MLKGGNLDILHQTDQFNLITLIMLKKLLIICNPELLLIK